MKQPHQLRRFLSLVDLDGPSFAAWRALILGAFAVKLDKQEAAIFRELTQRDPPTKRMNELMLAIGRRGGKNFVMARVAAYLATMCEWKLSPGEVGVVLCLANDRVQATVSLNYLKGVYSHPELRDEVQSITADRVILNNGIEIRVGTADNAAVRGITMLATLVDEAAFWPREILVEVLRALRPAMATQPQAMLIVISTVYGQQHPFSEMRRKYFGKDDPRVLFALASTRQMNPTISQQFIDDEMQRDPVANAAEYMSIERTDTENFLDLKLVDDATRAGPRELTYRQQLANGTHITYYAGIDISGGRNDATALAISHRDGEKIITDVVKRWPSPHDAGVVAQQVREFLATYKLTSAASDQYAAEIGRSLYAQAGVTLVDAPKNRSELYLSLLPLFTSGQVEIPDDPVLRQELLGLQRRTGRSGKDSVDHVPGQHDDVANALALSAFMVAKRRVATGDQVVTGHSILSQLGNLDGPGKYFDGNRLSLKDLFDV